MQNDLHHLRQQYGKHLLEESSAPAHPLELFHAWFQLAGEAEKEINKMVLATAGKSGIPTARIVLLKEYSIAGFVFYTNYNSQKGKHLAENPIASLLFYWESDERQVRIEGSVQQVSREKSVAYFNSRPLESRISAIVSSQSEVVTSRRVLEEDVEAVKESGQFDCPPHWGGYTLTPHRYEFWQGRENRLHDRLVYQLESGNWKVSRLAP